MTRAQLQKLSRKWHRFLGPLIGIQLCLWTLGGIYFSWFHIDNVHGDYERAAIETPDLRGLSEAMPIGTFVSRSELDRVEEIRVGTFLGRTVVRLYGNGDRAEMYDAATAARLSPINETEARRVAEIDFEPGSAIKKVSRIAAKGGEYKRGVPAWRVDFDNWKRTHVYVDARTGLVAARRNAIWRGFDFMWMLHILDFNERDNFNNWLLRIISVMGMATVVSGYSLWALTTPLFRGRKDSPQQ